MKTPSQKEIWYADLEPIRGGEQGGKRPVLVISGDTLNNGLPVVIVCPLTSKIKGYPGSVELSPTKENGLKIPSEVLTFHVRSIARNRLNKKIGILNKVEYQKVFHVLFDILTL